jgi:hypothetical protein
MISASLNYAIEVAVLMLIFWVILVLLGLKWRLFRTVRQGYSKLLKAMVVASAEWIWTPEMQRQGGGYIAQPSSEFQDKGADEWEELDQEDWP